MKNIARQQMSIKVSTMDLLNKQIKLEAHASATYLAMASWCDQNAFANSADFFYAQSAEEREHMMKIFRFITDCGGIAISPTVENINHDFSSLEEVFENALDHEIMVTKSIHELLATARKDQDYVVENFLQWFVAEQLEEEKALRDILDMFELMGRDGIALKFIDERIKIGA
ncbi:putative bacterial non-heme ferritin [Arenibacter antarcticus]|uniref:Ferritin n=1 Tax=Arenibacter antarcticus TaxID=2040469 RepID=A0ABW5VJC4_9FLAO|nr:ferritin [Arenibacter sp. H213]MCM4166827.1 ferritin [Arenibacter sp. H213]